MNNNVGNSSQPILPIYNSWSTTWGIKQRLSKGEGCEQSHYWKHTAPLVLWKRESSEIGLFGLLIPDAVPGELLLCMFSVSVAYITPGLNDWDTVAHTRVSWQHISMNLFFFFFIEATETSYRLFDQLHVPRIYFVCDVCPWRQIKTHRGCIERGSLSLS